MIKNVLIMCLALVLLSSSVAAQVNQTRSSSESDDVIRITTSLIQLDAVVVDKNGNQISQLTADDFEVFQDGKPQKITNLSYVSANAKANENRTTAEKAALDQVEIPTEPSAGRIITFVVDNGNCTASRIGIAAASEGLQKFVSEQMRPNDLVGIYQTLPGTSLSHQYTSDKTQLRLIISKINWSLSAVCTGRGGDLFERENADYTLKATGRGRRTFESPENRRTRESIEDTIRDNQTSASIETLRSITQRLRRVGGRKLVFFLSDGLKVVGRDNGELRSQNLLRSLIAESNQAGVVFNTIDIRGQFNAALLQAEDEVLPEPPDVAKPTSTERAIINRIAEARDSQDGLAILANETGGSISRGKNLADSAIRDLLHLERGYYLLAYKPDEDTFRGKKFHTIEIRLKRPDYRVLTRSGFTTPFTEDTKARRGTPSGELFAALDSPIPRNELGVRLSAFYSNTEFGTPDKEGDFIYSVIRLDGRDIDLVDDANGGKKAVLDVTMVLFDDKNKLTASFHRKHSVRIPQQDVAMIQEKGLTYPISLPVKKAGIYNLRVAVQDATSKRIGSAGQSVEVPDLKKKELFLPALNLSAVDKNLNIISTFSIGSNSRAVGVESANQRFRSGEILAYIYTLYNAQNDEAGNPPKLDVRVTLYHKGKILFDEQQQSPPLGRQTNWTRIDSGGYLKLDPRLRNGEYTLGIRIKDLLSGKTVEQLAGFELTE